MGMQNTMGDISRRLQKARSHAALRRYRQDEAERGLFVQVSPYVSESDVIEALSVVGISDGGSTWKGVERLSQTEVTGLHVPTISHVLTWEHHTRRGDVTGFQRFIQGAVGRIGITVAGSAVGLGWPWEDLIPIATEQAQRIESRLQNEF
jgi:hypothetical protein